MTTLLVDANNVAMRAVHAMARTGLTSDTGVATGPLLAFVNSLSKHVKEERPDKVVVCWDGGRSIRRTSLDGQYKAHRLSLEPEQEDFKDSVFSMSKEFCSLSNIFHIERPGVEADDLIAYYVHERDERVVILSSDKDFLQLLADDVEQVRLSSAGTPTDRWTRQRVVEEMGCEPSVLAYALALAGDDSDNVPGVPRFGMKTAIKELGKRGWDFDAVLENHPRAHEHAERAVLNLALVSLQIPLPGLDLPPLPWFSPTHPGDALYLPLMSFLRRYQMKTIQDRLNDGSLWG